MYIFVPFGFIKSGCVLQKGIYCDTIALSAGMMELADVTDSKSVVGDNVWVRVPLPAPDTEFVFSHGLFFEVDKR